MSLTSWVVHWLAASPHNERSQVQIPEDLSVWNWSVAIGCD